MTLIGRATWRAGQGINQRRLPGVLWKIVHEGLDAKGNAEFRTFKVEWNATKARVIKRGIPLLRDLEYVGRFFDDAIWEYARPLLRRLEELRRDPACWKDPTKARRRFSGGRRAPISSRARS